MMANITWRPGIGDPTWIGWITVAAYLISTIFCVQAGRHTRRHAREMQSESSQLWFSFAAGLFLLGINKQLDLQTAFIELGGQLALGQGWYQQRRLAQIIFVLLFGAIMIGALFLMVFQRRHFFKNHGFVLLGSIFLAAFVFLRAVIFNHVDDDFGLSLGEGNWLHGVELTGIFCFIIAGFRAGKKNLPKK